jgi:ABC-2 type transport system permease protein
VSRLVLARRLARDHRRGTVGWAAGIAVLVAVIVWAYPSISGSGGYAELLESYPEALKAMFGLAGGGDLASGGGYLHAELFSLMLPLLLIIEAVALSTDAVAGEEERHVLDLVLAHPVRRGRLVLERAASVAAITASLGVAAWLTMVVVGWSVGLGVSAARLGGGVVMSVALSWVMGALGLAVGAATGRRGLSAGVAGGAVALAFLMESLAPISDGIARVRWLSPFHYAVGGRPVVEGVDPGDLGVLLGAAAVLVLVAVRALDRRDIAG